MLSKLSSTVFSFISYTGICVSQANNLQYLVVQSPTGSGAEEINRCEVEPEDFLRKTNRKTPSPSCKVGVVHVCVGLAWGTQDSTQCKCLFFFFLCCCFHCFKFHYHMKQYSIYASQSGTKWHDSVFLFLSKATVMTLCGFLFILMVCNDKMKALAT